jgi:iron complex outermembrane receptor protein
MACRSICTGAWLCLALIAAPALRAQDSTPEASPAPEAAASPIADAPQETAAPLPLVPVAAAKDSSSPPPPPPAEDSGSRMLEEIVVTAQKRSELIQDVPVSVQAFSGEKLDAMGIYDQSDLQRVTPGLNVTVQVSYVMTFLRGIGTDATIAADPSVATYIDGVYFPFASLLAQNFGAVQRVEVLKGPQGTLFGRNATGGAISVFTKEPTLDQFGGELMANFGSFGTRLMRGHFNVPLGERYAASATAFDSGTDGYYDGMRGLPAEPFPRDHSYGYRVKFRALPIDELDIRLAALKLNLFTAAGSAAFTATPSQLGSLQGVQPQPGYEGVIDAYAYGATQNQEYYGSAEYHAPWFDAKLMGSDQHMDTSGIRDFDGSPQVLSTFETPSQYIDAQSAELQFTSSDRAGPDWLKWIAGAYYFRAVQGFASLNFIVNGIDLGAGSLAGVVLPDALVTFLRGNPALVTGAINLSGLVGTDSRAVYTQATSTLTDWLDLTLGGRYQIEERHIVESTVGLANQDGTQTQLIDNRDNATDSDGNAYPASDTQKDFSPKVSLELHPFRDDTLVYLSWQRAVKAATYNTIAIYDTPDYVAPEKVEAWELGAKTSLLDGLLRFNAAAFHYDVRNLQTYYLSTLAGGVISFQNAGRARIVGVDFDGSARLVPQWVDNLVLSGGAAWLKGKYLEFDGASGFDENGTFAQNQDYTGNRVMRTPAWSATLSLAKTWDVPGGPLEAVADAYYTSDFFYEASNRAVSRQEAYWLLGARLSYLWRDIDLRTTVGVKNLTDAFYSAGYFATDYGVQPQLAAPRSWFVQFIWGF